MSEQLQKQLKFTPLDKLDKKDFLGALSKDYYIEEFGLKDLNISARLLNHWSEMGILPDKRRSTDENHKFNFIELIWLKIVIELREYGFPISKIKIAKSTLLKETTVAEVFNYPNTAKKIQELESILSDNDSKNEIINDIFKKRFPLLILFIIDVIANKQDSKIYVFKDGTAIPFPIRAHGKFPELEMYLNKDSYITIPFVMLLKEFVEEERYFEFISRAKILNSSEVQIMELIRNGNAKTITIHFKNDQPEFIDVKKYKNVFKETRFGEIILKKAYQKIELVTNEGNISYTAVTTKYKLK